MHRKDCIIPLIVLLMTTSCTHSNIKQPDINMSEVTHEETTASEEEESVLKMDKNDFGENFRMELSKPDRFLSSFFADEWTLVYHEYNRSTGSTDGKKESLKAANIDETIPVDVFCDGEGWFEQRDPKKYVFEFSLNELVKNWDRFEIQLIVDEERKEEAFMVEGGGASDYLILFYKYTEKGKLQIVEMIYNSVDPG